MRKLCAAIADNESFQGFILALIVLNALCMGAEATPALADQYGDWLYWVFLASQAIFVAEITIRVAARAPDVRGFFGEFWNSFDFTIVALSLVPAVGSFTLAARLLRVLRLVRVFSVSDRLRGFFDGVRSGAPVVGVATVVLLVLGYVFALSGVYLFGEALPLPWGTLGRALLSVAQLLLFQGGDVLTATCALSKASLLYFALLYVAQFAVLANALGAIAAPYLRRAEGG